MAQAIQFWMKKFSSTQYRRGGISIYSRVLNKRQREVDFLVGLGLSVVILTKLYIDT